MKKVGLFVLLVLFLVACSNDVAESNENNNENSNNDNFYNEYEQNWEHDFKGFKSKITKVVTTNKVDVEGISSHMIGIKLEIENTSDHDFFTNAGFGMLTLSTGETIDKPFDFSPSGINGNIASSAIITSNINFDVGRDVDEIEWVQFQWYVSDEAEDSTEKESYAVKLDLN